MVERAQRYWIPGRPVSQKNSKIVSVSPSGRPTIRSSDEVRRWREGAVVYLREQMIRAGTMYSLGSEKQALEVSVVCHFDEGQRIDVDNAGACVLDALQDAQVISNDRWVEDLHGSIRCGIREPGYEVEVRVKETVDVPARRKTKRMGRPPKGN